MGSCLSGGGPFPRSGRAPGGSRVSRAPERPAAPPLGSAAVPEGIPPSPAWGRRRLVGGPRRSLVSRERLSGGHEEPPTAPQESYVLAVAPEQGSKESCLEAFDGALSGSSRSPGDYHVTALATSSLGGLVQTIKDHVTKPTAMAHGRLAHLIEWKGWSAPQTGWEPSLADVECYADLADELKEARFAAGVAEQFAILEATLNACSSLDGDELHGRGVQDAIQLQDLGSLYLQNFLFGQQDPSGLHLADGIQAFSPPSCVSPIPNEHCVANGWSSLGGSLEKPPPSRGEQESSPSSLWQPQSSLSLRYVDSSSLSEDEVFYNE